MNKARFFAVISIFLIMVIAPLQVFGQSQHLEQTLKWQADKNAMEYKVEVQNLDSGEKSSYKTSENFITVKLFAGHYKYRVFVYDFLDRESNVSEWRSFDVIKALAPKVTKSEKAENSVTSVKSGSKVKVPLEVTNIDKEAKVELINTETKKSVEGTLQTKNSDGQLVAASASFPQVEEGTWKVRVTNPGGLYAESQIVKVIDQVKSDKSEKEVETAVAKSSQEEKNAKLAKAEKEATEKQAAKDAEKAAQAEARAAKDAAKEAEKIARAEESAAAKAAEEKAKAEEKAAKEAEKQAAEEARLKKEAEKKEALALAKRQAEEAKEAERLAKEAEKKAKEEAERKAAEEKRILDAQKKAEEARLRQEEIVKRQAEAQERARVREEQAKIAAQQKAERKAQQELLAQERAQAAAEREAKAKEAEEKYQETLKKEKEEREAQEALEKQEEEDQKALEQEKKQLAQEEKKLARQKQKEEKAAAKEERKIAWKNRKMIDLNIQAGGGAVFNLYDGQLFAYSDKDFLPMVKLDISLLPIKIGGVKVGFEVNALASYLKTDNEFYSMLMPLGIFNFDLAMKFPLIKEKVYIATKGGGGVSLIDMQIEYAEGVNRGDGTNKWYGYLCANGELSLVFLPAKGFTIEAGADFTHIFIKDMPTGCISPFLNIGVRF